MAIVSISLTGDLLKRIDGLVRERGYSSRSEAIRDAVRDYLADFEVSRFEKGRVTATVTVISGHEKHDVDEKLTKLRHEHDRIVSGNMHIHLGAAHCMEIFITEGEAEEVMGFIARIRALKDIQQVKYTVTPLAKRE